MKCKDCKIELIPEVNWIPSHVNKKFYVCRKCFQKRMKKPIREWKERNKKRLRVKGREWDFKTRHFYHDKIMDFLGNKCSNPKCLVPNGCRDIRCLQIDHVNGNGNKERESFFSTYQYYKFIYEKLLQGSKDYQLLCANCNLIKREEKKECCQAK